MLSEALMFFFSFLEIFTPIVLYIIGYTCIVGYIYFFSIIVLMFRQVFCMMCHIIIIFLFIIVDS